MAQTEATAQGYTELRTYRYERKFLVQSLSLPQVQALVRLHPQLFHQPYPPRYVNNLYLDTPDLENYYDNVYGAARRRKVRVRWYGEIEGQIDCPLLEFKVKDGQVGTKHTYPLASFSLDASCSGSSGGCYLQEAVTRSSLPERVRRELRDLDIVLLNRYYRHYYASRDGQFRLTLDTGLTFLRVNGVSGGPFIHRQVNFQDLVVELKYEIDQEPRADHVSSFFPFPVTRSSKYVQGMERVYF